MAKFRVGWILFLIMVFGLNRASYGMSVNDLPEFLNFWSEKPKKPNPAFDSAKGRFTRSSIGDSSIYPYEVESSQLPMIPGTNKVNDRYMPVLSSGIIASTVYSNVMYVHNLYTGKGANSHRANVPGITLTRVRLFNDESERLSVRKFRFNVKEGYFMEEIDCPYAYIKHMTYIHQSYVRVIVTHVTMTKKSNIPGGTIYFDYPSMNSTKDIRFDQPMSYNHVDWQVRGSTTEAEEASGSTNQVYAYYMNQRRDLSLQGRELESATMLMAVDTQDTKAKSNFDRARLIIDQQGGADKLFQEHKEVWRKTWERGLIEIQGDVQLSKITWFSQYYLLSSLPPLFPQDPPNLYETYYGISRNSLGKGGTPSEYNGHIFWDNEMYIMPALTLLHPEHSKSMLRFRAKFSPKARDYAQETGGQGYRYPWETAFSGIDVTPDKCIACRENALHVTAAVGWAIRHYYTATRDKGIISDNEYNSFEMSREIARFWADKCVYNTSKGRYDINDVMGPDDWHPKVNNNAYTNVMASLAIHWARYFACVCNRNEKTEVPDDWVMKALYLDLPYDNVQRVHYQFDGFEKLPKSNQTSKQADTILMTYPVGWNMSRDIMHNDLDYYELLTDSRTPAMTYSFFTVGWKWVDEDAKMSNHFATSYQDYVVQPFKIWTEYSEGSAADQKASSVNFLPAAGAYMQSLIYGFGGFRIRPEFLEVYKPQPPPGCTMMSLTGFDYLGTSMDIEIRTDYVKIRVTGIGEYDLILKRNQSSLEDEKLVKGAEITIDRPQLGFYIYTTDPSPCEHPMDYIFMPWGYAPWMSGSEPRNIPLVLLGIGNIIALSWVALLR